MRRIAFYLITAFAILGHHASRSQSNCSASVQTTPPSCSGVNDGKVNVLINGQPGGSALPCLAPLTSSVTCSSCSQTISSNPTSVSVAAGQKVCITGNFGGSGKTLTISGTGSTIVICGSITVNPSTITINSGATSTIVVNTGATFTTPSTLSAMTGITLKNYGTTNVAASTLSFNGSWENNGTLNTKILTIVSPGQLTNYKTTTVTGGITNGGTVTNNASLTLTGTGSTFTNNGTLNNQCQMFVGTDVINSSSKTINNNGGMGITGWLKVNSSSTYKAGAGSRVVTTNLQVDGTAQGVGTSCGSIKVSSTTNLSSTSILSGQLDVCDATGVDTHIGQVNSPATINCSCTSSEATYTWASPLQSNTGPNVTGIAPGNYSVTVQPAGCSTATVSNFTISATPLLTASVTLNGGLATAMVSGGTPGYTYTWSGASGTANTQNYTQAGTYTLTVKDSKLCTATATFTISAVDCNITVNMTNTTCPGGTDGTATIMANGAVLSQVKGPVGTPATCLPPNTPAITCSSGCTQTITSSTPTASVTVASGQKVCITTTAATPFTGSISVTGGTLVICGTANPQIFNINPTSAFTLIVTGSLNFPNLNLNQTTTTLKNYGTITTNTIGFNGILENNGTMTVAGDLSINGSSAVLSNYSQLTVQGNLNNFNGTSNFGAINVAGSFNNNGGSGLTNKCQITIGVELTNTTTITNFGNISVATYSRLNGGSFYKGESGSILTTGNLQLDGTAQGIGTSCAAIRVTNLTTLNGSSILSGKMDICDANGIENKFGTITSPATTNCSCLGAISWSSPLVGGLNPYTGLAVGTYSVSVNTPGCIPATKTFTITSPPTLTATVQITGKKAIVTASGGTPPLTYTFTGEGSGTGNVHNYVNDGRYSVTIADSRNCSIVRSFDIGDSTNGTCAKINVNYTSDGKVTITCDCPGSCAVLDGNHNPTSTNTFIRPTHDTTFTVLPPDGDPQHPLIVVVQGTNNNPNNNNGNNNNTSTGTLTVNNTTTFETGPGANNGTITLSITGGSGSYTIINSTNGQTNGTTITGLPGGTTTVTVLDNITGQVTTKDVFIGTVPPLTVGVTHTGTPATPSTVTVQVTRYPLISPTGDPYPTQGPYTVTLSTDPTHPVTSSTGTVTSNVPLGTTSVTVTVIDAVGRSVVTVTTWLPACTTAYTPTFTTVLPNCHGSKNGQISITNVPANTTVQWSGASTAITGATAAGLGAGTYNVILTQTTAGVSCVLYNGPVTLSEPAALSLNVTKNLNVFTAQASGGTLPYGTYTWSNSTTGTTATLTIPGTYSVSITDNKGCTAVHDVLVPPVNCFGTIGLSPLDPSCPGSKDGRIDVTFTGAGATYFWTGPGVTNPTATFISNIGQGTYFVAVKQTSPACISYAGITLPDPVQMEAFYQISGTNTVTIIAKNGVPNYQIKWRLDNLITDVRNDLIPGRTYTVDITDSRGCTLAYSFKYSLCGSDPVTLYVLVNGQSATPVVSGGTGIYTYLWTPITTGITIANPTAGVQTNLPNGQYKLVVNDSKNCNAQANFQLANCGLTVTPSLVTPPSCPAQCDGKATVSISPLAAGTTVQWDGSVTGIDLIHACADTHRVRVITQAGCALEKILVIAPAAPTCPGTDGTGTRTCLNNNLNIALVQKIEKKCFSDQSFVNVTVTGGLAPLTYTWTGPGAGTLTETYISDKEDLENPQPGAYSLVVKDVNGCTANYNVSVTGPASSLQASAVVTPAICVGAKASAMITVTGGKAPYTYLWPGGSTLAVRNDLDSGVYNITIHDAAGCQVMATALVNKPVFSGEIFSSRRKLCPGERAVLTAAQAPGYTYLWTGPGVPDTFHLRSYTTTLTGVYTLQYLQSGCTTQSINITIAVSPDSVCHPRSIICQPIELATDSTDPNRDCIAQKMIAAQAYGVYSYNNYLEEERRKFKTNYKNQILNQAQETLTMQYTDSEHQYTLYYYDQAGNLVRTVPPAGVVALSNTEEPLAENDLLIDTSTVFTNHTLATTYRYNSLNQLVGQDVPDNSRQDLWEPSSSAITLNGQVPAAIAYGTSSNGLLLANTTTNAGIFASADGGKTWTEQVNIGISDLRSVFKADANNAYAAGDNGTFLKSADGGQTWIIKSAPTASKIVKIFFSTGTTGLIMNDSGTVWSTSDGGSTWTAPNVSLKQKLYQLATPQQVFSNVWFDGSDIWAVSNDISGSKGHIWYSAGVGNGNANGNDTGNGTWTEQTSFLVGELNSVQTDVSGNNYVAAGPAGSFFSLDAVTGVITLIRSDLPVLTNQLVSKSSGYLAVGQDNKLYASSNGIAWTVPSGLTSVTNIKQTLNISASLDVAVTSAGTFTKSVSGGAWSAPANTGLTSVNKIRLIPNSVLGTVNTTPYIVLSGDQIVYSPTASPDTWTVIPVSGLAAGTQIQDAWVLPTTPRTWVLQIGGSLYNTTESTTTPGTLNAITLASPVLTNVKNLYPSGATLYALQTTLAIQSTTNGTSFAAALTALPATSGNLLDLTIQSFAPFKALAVYDAPATFEINGGSWVNISDRMKSSALNAIEGYIAGTSYAAGANGEIYKRLTGASSSWQYQPHATSGLTFSTLGVDAAGLLHLVSGNNIYNYASGIITSEFTSATGPVTSMDVALSGNGLAVSQQGQIFTRTATAWNITSAPSGVPLNAVDAFGANNGLAGGTAGNMLVNRVPGWNNATTPRPEPLTALAYGDPTHVVAVGKQGTILTSANAGQNWIPRYSGSTNDLNTVTAFGVSKTVTGGLNGTLKYTSNGGATWLPSIVSPVLGTTAVNAVRTANGTTVLAIAGTRLLRSVNGGANFSNESLTLTSTGYDLWLDVDGYGFIVGDNSMAYRISPNGANFTYTLIATDATPSDDRGTGLSAGAAFRTVQFSDRLTGYITGTHGLVLKTVDGGQHWKTESAGTGTGIPVIALGDGENGSLLNADGTVSALRDRAEEMSSRFWYDEIGRMVLSQNAKQFNITSYNTAAQNTAVTGTGNVQAYSYTLYDKIGRITEVGELLTRSTPPLGKYESQVLYNSVTNTFVPGGIRREITRTYYDSIRFKNIANNFTQQNLRPRVASVTYQDVDGAAYDRATHYSYDVHGNVKTLIQEIKSPFVGAGSVSSAQFMGGHGDALLKRMDYEYDLVSGKVNYVWYQKDKPDQFIHQYQYDGDNRLTAAFTSRDGEVWDRDAAYQYYGHGPLTQTITGQENVETQDHAYTLQGWSKGLNGQNFSYALGYFSGDYTAINGQANGIQTTPIARSLYNGNIATMAGNTPAFSTPLLTQQFEYDQLNRITNSKVTNGASSNSYKTSYTFDLNGNISALNRNDASGQPLDRLAYNYEQKSKGYEHNTNKLRWVDDAVNTVDKTDLEDQAQDNYQYDDLGNLTKDNAEDIAGIDWNVYGKIRKVTRKAGSDFPDMEFAYDATGNRIAKKIIEKTGDTTITYYLRDASGNIMAVYKKESTGVPLVLAENNIFGSSRIGVSRPGSIGDLPVTDTTVNYTRTAGLKDYEIVDHLGNVRVVLSDLRTGTGTTGVVSANDYYAFGMTMPGRSFNSSEYRYGFNGKEKDDEIDGSAGSSYDYGFRIYNPQIARFLSVDPISNKYPELTPYQFASNTPIQAVDLDGLEMYFTTDGSLLGKFGNSTEIRVATDKTIIDKIKEDVKSLNNLKEKEFTSHKLSYASLDETLRQIKETRDSDQPIGTASIVDSKGKVMQGISEKARIEGNDLVTPETLPKYTEPTTDADKDAFTFIHSHPVDAWRLDGETFYKVPYKDASVQGHFYGVNQVVTPSPADIKNTAINGKNYNLILVGNISPIKHVESDPVRSNSPKHLTEGTVGAAFYKGSYTNKTFTMSEDALNKMKKTVDKATKSTTKK